MNVMVGTAAALASAATATEARPASLAGEDHIFAAIQRHREAFAAFEHACSAANRLEESLPPEPRRKPRVYLGDIPDLETTAERDAEGAITVRQKRSATNSPVFADSIEDIEQNATMSPKGQREAWIKEKLAALKADEEMLREAQAAAGLIAAQEAVDAASDAEFETAWDLIDVALDGPVTTPGVVALLRYAAERTGKWRPGFLDGKEISWERELHRRIADVMEETFAEAGA
jgi:hypothetical protein